MTALPSLPRETMQFDILSLFPEMFDSMLRASLAKRAIEKSIVSIHTHNIRDYAAGKHRVTDDTPYGGGGGMVMKVEPIARALEALAPEREHAIVVLLSPQGERFTQQVAESLSRYARIILICGHYEGIDERVRKHLVDRELSIGDFVLSGGEPAAMVVIDAVSRLIPGYVGNSVSVREDSYSTGLLEGPHYTRPRDYRGWKVPEILLSGHQKQIEAWRRQEALKRTYLRRPDLLEKAALTEEDRRILAMLALHPSRDEGEPEQ